MKSATLASLALVVVTHMIPGVSAATQGPPSPRPSQPPALGNQRSQGCFSSPGNLTKHEMPDGPDGKKLGVSMGGCWNLNCKLLDPVPKVFALHGNECLCGDFYPEFESKIKDSECSANCPAYPQEPCGGLSSDPNDPGAWSVYNSGEDLEVKYLPEEKPETTSKKEVASKTASGPDATSTDAQGRPTSSGELGENNGEDGGKKDEGGPNVAAIAAGVVVGVVVIAALIGGAFFYMRRKRNAEIEEEHRRNAAVNAFISGAKPPGSSGNVSMSDSRLEPGLAHRRLSDGSIADNQDYSRKILRVTNA